VRTPLVEAQVADQARAHGIPEERVLEEVLLAPQARKELIEPDEVAEAVSWLLGPAGRFTTGSPLLLDAGWLAR
jgi:3-hydroxybutyrate dehydrogenase